MTGDLLEQVVEGGLYGRGGRRRLFLGSHLSGGQAQVQRDNDSLAGRIFLDQSLEVNKFGTEHLQPLAQFFDLLVHFFFDVGSFADFVSDMNVHESLECRE